MTPPTEQTERSFFLAHPASWLCSFVVAFWYQHFQVFFLPITQLFFYFFSSTVHPQVLTLVNYCLCKSLLSPSQRYLAEFLPGPISFLPYPVTPMCVRLCQSAITSRSSRNNRKLHRRQLQENGATEKERGGQNLSPSPLTRFFCH